MKKKRIRRTIRITWFTFVAIFIAWQFMTYQSRGVDREWLMSSGKIEVESGKDKISFLASQASSEVLFFPGGLVDPKAYVPLARKISEAGHNVHIIKMPWRMSTKGYNQIKSLFDLNDPSKTYILGGHSQGAKMAAQFTYENPSQISGLFLLGTSHPRDIDMSNIDLPTLKVYAEHDGLASVPEVMQNKALLPQKTQLTQIDGANHSQFAYTGRLLMDGKASINRQEQQAQTLELLLAFFNRIEEKKSSN